MSGEGEIVSVRGGSHGVVVQHEQARALATAYAAAGDHLRTSAAATAAVAAQPDLVESSVLAPPTFLHAEESIALASVGPDGLLVCALAWDVDAVTIHAVVDAFEARDLLVAATFEAIDYAAGRAVGTAVGTGLPALVVTGALLRLAWPQLPPELRSQVTATFGARASQAQDVLEHQPELLERLFNAGGGVIDGFWAGAFGHSLGPDGRIVHPSTESAAALLATLYPADGKAVVRPHAGSGDPDRHTGRPSSVAPVVPRNLADLIANLGQVAALSDGADSAHNGTISIQTLDGPQGRRHVVYLPGTDDFSTPPWGQDGDVRDAHTNLLAVGGHETTYAQGVREAMVRSGIEPGEPVLVVGHSQGGMIANQVASQPGPFNVTDVVTAGSPIGAQPAHDVRTLSLENRADVIPLVEGEANGQGPHQVTAQFEQAYGTFVENHSYAAYVAGAEAADGSADPSLRDAVSALEPFLAGDGHSSVRVHQIVRTTPDQ